MNYQKIDSDRNLADYCNQLAQCRSIAFDTEFVSENTYRPVLCLIQVAADDRLAVIDPLTIDDMTPFWDVLAAEGHETIVHAARGEVEFCLEAIGKLPAGLVDVQLAAGLAGVEYPAGYATLIARLLGRKTSKHETRTDWFARPLSDRQIDYALDDVRYLHPLRDALFARLEQLDRLSWLAEEMAEQCDQIAHSLGQHRWRRVSGSSGLNRRSLAIVRELWQWRDEEARRRNKPARWILRDDLIAELARRRTADPQRILAVRGMQRRDLSRLLPAMVAAIQRALDLEEGECPEILHKEKGPQLSVLGQFLFAALGSVCRHAKLAPNLVGSPSDIRDLVAYRTGDASKPPLPPRLARGWRAEFVGRLFDDLLAGKKVIRIADPASDHPLVFEPGE